MEWIKQEIKDKPIGSWRYAYGRIAALEMKLLSDDQIARLFNVSDYEEFQMALNEFGYGGDDFEQIMERAELEDTELLSEISPEAIYQARMLLFNDVHNMKALARAVWTGEEAVHLRNLRHLIISPFSVDPEDLLSELRGEKTLVPQEYKEWMQQAHVAWLTAYEPWRIDEVMDHHMWEKISSELHKEKSPWFKRWFKLNIDLINIEMILRALTLVLLEHRLQEALLTGGTLRTQDLLAVFHEPELLSDFLENNGFVELKEVPETYAKSGGASEYAMLADRMKIDLLQEARLMAPGPERVYAYIHGRRMERRNIKLARACLLNRVEPERARLMIRPAVGQGG